MGASDRGCCRHPRDEGADLGADAWPPDGGPSGEPGPVLPKALALPAENGVGGDDHERLPPLGPHPGKADGSSVYGDLVAQGEILDGEVTMAADEGGRSRSRWSRTVIIGWRSSPARRGQINHLAAEGVLAKEPP